MTTATKAPPNRTRLRARVGGLTLILTEDETVRNGSEVRVIGRGKYIKFENGFAVVDDETLALVKENPRWNVDIWDANDPRAPGASGPRVTQGAATSGLPAQGSAPSASLVPIGWDEMKNQQIMTALEEGEYDAVLGEVMYHEVTHRNRSQLIPEISRRQREISAKETDES